MPTTAEIIIEKHKLIESGELTIGEPCTPYIINKSIVNSSGELEVRPSEICGRKIPLLELRKKLLVKQEKYMRICNTSIADEELLQLALSVGYQLSTSIDTENAIAELKAYQTKPSYLARSFDHFTDRIHSVRCMDSL